MTTRSAWPEVGARDDGVAVAASPSGVPAAAARPPPRRRSAARSGSPTRCSPAARAGHVSARSVVTASSCRFEVASVRQLAGPVCGRPARQRAHARWSSMTGCSTSETSTAREVARVSAAIRSWWARAASATSAARHDRQRDPVGDLEAGVAPGLLDRAHQVAGHALGLELGGQRGVEHHEAAARQHPGGGVVAATGDGLERVLALLQHQATRGDRAVVGHRPVAGLRRLDRGLHVLAQPRAGGAGVDREPLGDAVRRGVGVLGRRAGGPTSR